MCKTVHLPRARFDVLIHLVRKFASILQANMRARIQAPPEQAKPELWMGPRLSAARVQQSAGPIYLADWN